MWSRVLAFVALLLWPATSWSAVAFDAVGSATGAGVTSLSFSLTTAGSDRVLAGAGLVYTIGATVTSSITYNSVALTDITTANGVVDVNHRYLIAPATGANTFQCNFSSTASNDLACIGLSMTGVDQTTAIGTAVAATGTSTTPSATVSAATDDLVVDLVAIGHTAAFSVGAGQTQRVNAIALNGFIKYAASTEPGVSSVTMDWTNGGSADWATVAVPYKAVAVGGGGTSGFLLRNMLGGGK